MGMGTKNQGQSYYEVLEIPVTAGQHEIHHAYLKAKSTYSSDSPALYTMFTAEEAQALINLIEEAYAILGHQGKRREYDLQMGYQTAPEAVERSVASSVDTVIEIKPLITKNEDGWLGQVKIHKRKDDLPEGFARTKFSVYQLNNALEEELKSIAECDGLFLQKVRHYKGVKLEQLCEEIRVTKATLVALEANDLEALPAAVFVRGYVLQLARVLGLDEKRIADAYMKYYRTTHSS